MKKAFNIWGYENFCSSINASPALLKHGRGVTNEMFNDGNNWKIMWIVDITFEMDKQCEVSCFTQRDLYVPW